MTGDDQRATLDRRSLLLAAGALAAGATATPGIAAAAPAPTGRYRIDLHAHFLPPDYRGALLEHGHLTIGG